jgi:hypothetical protein
VKLVIKAANSRTSLALTPERVVPSAASSHDGTPRGLGEARAEVVLFGDQVSVGGVSNAAFLPTTGCRLAL